MTDVSRGDRAQVWTHDRAHLWLPLLRDLTRSLPERLVFKGSQAAFDGVSDVDAYAAPTWFPSIERRFRAWAADHGLHVAVVCRHDWRGPTMVAIRSDDPYPFTLDVKVGRLYRGSFLFTIDDLHDLAALDDLDIRRLRTGAEGAIKLLVFGTTRSGRRNQIGFATKDIHGSLVRDSAGAMTASRFAGVAAPALRRGIQSVLDGGWSRRDMAMVAALCHARAVGHPDRLFRQLYWRLDAGPSCAVSQLVERRMPDDRERWLRDVAASHRVSGFLGVSDGVLGVDRRAVIEQLTG